MTMTAAAADLAPAHVPPLAIATRAYDVAVVGAGPAGLSAALALATLTPGLQIAAIGPRPPSSGAADTRTVALFGPSLTLLGRLGLLGQLEANCAPITSIRLIDDTGGLLRAPEIVFEPHEIGLDRFGLNVPNGLVVDLLEQAVANSSGIDRLTDATVVAAQAMDDGVRLRLADDTELTARLAVAADGRGSVTRAASGVAVRTWDYEQVAIVTRFAHSRPHHGISSEVHRPNGPCTVVPLPGNESSLVWVERPAIARRLVALDDHAFGEALTAALNGLLGRIEQLAPRRAIPLTGMKPAAFAARRTALVGEAAHVFPPIGAQGLNLGLRDAAGLADAVAAAGNGDPGGDDVLAAYDRGRQVDVGTRTLGVDLLGRSLTSANPAFGLARGLGLYLAHAIPPLRRAMIGAGLGPVGTLPSLMRQ